MRFLALDLSKRSTGFAIWDDTMERPILGCWELGSELTSAGTSFIRLHQRMNDLHMVTPFDNVLYETPLNLGPGAGITNADTIFALVGLAAHVDSFCEAKSVRKYRTANMSSWRGHFLGSIPRGPIKDRFGNKLKRKPIDWKSLSMERAREFGMEPRRHDEAEAFGILDYQVDLEGITPPWRVAVPMVRQFGVRGK